MSAAGRTAESRAARSRGGERSTGPLAAVWINGRRGTRIDWSDRGLQYGDGLFETMLVREHRVRVLEYHLDRLLAGCRVLGLPAPSRRALEREIAGIAARRRDGILKLMLTRGPGARGYRPTGAERCTRILSLQALPPVTTDPSLPVRVRMCATQLGCNPALAGLKTLNRLESVLARSEWRDPLVWEGLMRDTDENLISGTMSNLFIRRGSLILTPLLDRCGVAGVMRRRILETAADLGFEARERRIRWADLSKCDEAFMSNAIVGVKSVARIERGRQRIVLRQADAAAVLRARLHV
ncbi:MAG TPA: aminodeoxychorismate lyase [Steroidobacteraceae bacterium]|nr:aminodeoxychorismate lyase [Steroidobacteraceae bacterium]